MNWYVYILKCADGSLYTGITNNLESRLRTHNEKKGAKYTRSRLPVTLATHFVLPSKSEALKEEACIKSLTREKKLELINKNNNKDFI